MKNHFIPLSFLLLSVLASCKKEVIDKTSSLQSIHNGTNTSAQAALQSMTDPTFNVVDNGDGTFTATLQPDSSNGQDVHVSKLIGSPENANTNFNSVPEMVISAWTVNGSPLFLRGYLRFADLTNIPATATVVSATLYLYGLSNSITGPQGNSTYPGSPYSSFGTNRCVIEPVESYWDENTITWNTQPKVSDKLQVTIPPSTTQWNYDVALSDVKGLVARGVKYPDKNFGVTIRLAEETKYRNMEFTTSEIADPSRRPKLVVTYSN